MKAEKGRRGAGDEDTHLIDGAVSGVEGAVGSEGRAREGEEECGRDAKVDCVLRNIDKKEREHAAADGFQLGFMRYLVKMR